MEQLKSIRPTMPQAEKQAATVCSDSQMALYRSLPTGLPISTMVASQTPTIAKIKNKISEADIRALLTIAVGEVCNFFNVGKNMNDIQVAMTVDLIIDRFWYFKLEEIKYCFRRAMMREKLFDRLDGNIIIGWLSEYDFERTEEAMRLSDQKETQELNEYTPSPDAITFKEYVEQLTEAAKTDEKAADRLAELQDIIAESSARANAGAREQKEKEFKMWKTFNYDQGKKF